MIKNQIKILFIVLSFVTFISCGSNGGGSAGERPFGTVEGKVVDAEIVDGTVTIYAFKNGVKGDVLETTVTDEKGFYSADIRAPDQHVLIEIKGGSYTEEASGTTVNLKDGQVLRAIIFYQSGSPLSLMVTPFTNLAAGFAQYKITQGAAIENAVTEASSAISSMAGVDILKTVPLNITDSGNTRTQLNDGLKYGFMASAVSSWTAEASQLNGSAVHTIWNSIAFAQIMYRDISEDGLLDGKGIDPDTKEVVELGFGLVLIDANTYRSGLAKHLMMMVGSEANQTGISFQQAVPEADRLGNMTHEMFGGLAPVPFDTEGPVITPAEAEGLFHNDVFNFSVSVSDIVGLKSVVFDIDGEDIGQAADPANPFMPINTHIYADGEYLIGVRALDNLNNMTYQRFRIHFLNSGSSLNLLSSTFVNRSPVTLFGNYIDNGPGIQSIVVDGVLADIDLETRTWTAIIPLTDPTSPAAFKKDVSFVITDGLGVQNTELITLMMDAIPPKFDPAPLYSNATFISNGTVFTDKLSFAESSDIPVRIETDNISLNGTPILTGPLDQKGIPWIVLRAVDVNVGGVFTPKDEITAEIQYSLAGTLMTSWHPLEVVLTGTNNYRFIVPLVSEVLHEGWHQATPNDQHLIEVKIKDKAGNTTDYSFRFFVEFVPPAPLIVSKAVNSFNRPFNFRFGLFNRSLQTVELTITNPSNYGLLFSVSNLPNVSHSVSNTVEEAIRQHAMTRAGGTEWRAQKRFRIVGDPSRVGGWSVTQDTNAPWEMIQRLLIWTTGPTGAKPLPTSLQQDDVHSISNDNQLHRSTQRIVVPLATDRLPPTDYGPWTPFHPTLQGVPGSPRLCCNVNYFLAPPISGGAAVNYPFAYDASSGHFLEFRRKTGWLSIAGPANVYTTFVEKQDFTNQTYEVANETGDLKIPINGFFQLAPQATYTIKGFAITPDMTLYNDVEVADPATFRDYTKKRYDNKIEWTINNQLVLNLVHDVGFEKVPEMVTLTSIPNLENSVYTISR